MDLKRDILPTEVEDFRSHSQLTTVKAQWETTILIIMEEVLRSLLIKIKSIKAKLRN